MTRYILFFFVGLFVVFGYRAQSVIPSTPCSVESLSRFFQSQIQSYTLSYTTPLELSEIEEYVRVLRTKALGIPNDDRMSWYTSYYESYFSALKEHVHEKNTDAFIGIHSPMLHAFLKQKESYTDFFVFIPASVVALDLQIQETVFQCYDQPEQITGISVSDIDSKKQQMEAQRKKEALLHAHALNYALNAYHSLVSDAMKGTALEDLSKEYTILQERWDLFTSLAECFEANHTNQICKK